MYLVTMKSFICASHTWRDVKDRKSDSFPNSQIPRLEVSSGCDEGASSNFQFWEYSFPAIFILC